MNKLHLITYHDIKYSNNRIIYLHEIDLIAIQVNNYTLNVKIYVGDVPDIVKCVKIKDPVSVRLDNHQQFLFQIAIIPSFCTNWESRLLAAFAPRTEATSKALYMDYT